MLGSARSSRRQEVCRPSACAPARRLQGFAAQAGCLQPCRGQSLLIAAGHSESIRQPAEVRLRRHGSPSRIRQESAEHRARNQRRQHSIGARKPAPASRAKARVSGRYSTRFSLSLLPYIIRIFSAKVGSRSSRARLGVATPRRLPFHDPARGASPRSPAALDGIAVSGWRSGRCKRLERPASEWPTRCLLPYADR